MKILSSQDIRSLEKETIAHSTPAITLMEEAGHKAFLYFQKNIRTIASSKILICCGPGNNGGDGLVLARYFSDFRAQVDVFILSPDQKLKTPEANEQLKNLESKNVTVHWIRDSKSFDLLDEKLPKTDWIIDAVFGIGLDKPLQGLFLDYVRWLEDAQKKRSFQICSLDIPTGLNADTGDSMGASVAADLTLTFEFYKKGFYQRDGLFKTGKIVRLPIGIAWNEKIVQQKYFHSVESSFLPSFPKISRAGHKKVRGHALIIAGSKEKSGAAILASLASMRAGVGLSTVAVPSVAHGVIKSQLINVMSEEIPSNSSSQFEKNALDVVSKFIQDKTAVLIGPGLAPDSNRTSWIEKILPHIRVPLVIDAQALSDIGDKMKEIDFSKHQVVITPHPGEMSRLTGFSTTEIQHNRFDVVEEFAKLWNVTVILKGAHTLVGLPNGDIFVNQVDHPCLSVAGTGDVLSGILVSYLAQGLSVQDASILAVYTHGRAGERLGQRMSVRGVLASDLFNEIPQVIHEIDSNTIS